MAGENSVASVNIYGGEFPAPARAAGAATRTTAAAPFVGGGHVRAAGLCRRMNDSPRKTRMM